MRQMDRVVDNTVNGFSTVKLRKTKNIEVHVTTWLTPLPQLGSVLSTTRSQFLSFGGMTRGSLSSEPTQCACSPDMLKRLISRVQVSIRSRLEKAPWKSSLQL